MSLGTHPLPTLGQGQIQHGTSDPAPHFNRVSTVSGATAVDTSEESLTTETLLDALGKDRKFQSSRSISAIETSLYTDSRFLFPVEPPEFSWDEVQLRLQVQHRLQRLFVVVGLQKATIPDEAQATTRPSYRGRITGPVQFVNKLLDTWHLGPESACILLGFELSQLSYVNDVLQGYETLTGRDAKDRIVHLFQIRASLSALFRDEAVENEWLKEARDVLKGQTPMDLLLEGSMENLLLVKEYVELVART